MKEVLCALVLLTYLHSLTVTNSFNKDEESLVMWHDTSLSKHFLLLAANHSLYKHIAMGTLNRTNFFGFIQQDDAYVTSLFDSVQILHDRLPESDHYTRKELKHVLEGREKLRNYFQDIYDNSNEELTTPKYLDPITVGMTVIYRLLLKYLNNILP